MDAQDDEPGTITEAPAAPKRRGRLPKAAPQMTATEHEGRSEAVKGWKFDQERGPHRVDDGETPAPPATRTIKALRKLHIDPVDVIGHGPGMSIKLDPSNPAKDTLGNVKAEVADRLIRAGLCRAV